MNQDRLRQNLRRIMREEGLNPYKWGTIAGVNEGAIRKFLKDTNSSLTTKTISKLAEAIGKEASYLLRAPQVEVAGTISGNGSWSLRNNFTFSEDGTIKGTGADNVN